MEFLIGKIERSFLKNNHSRRTDKYNLTWLFGGSLWTPNHFYSEGLLEIKMPLPAHCVSVRNDFVALKVIEEVLMDNNITWIIPGKNGWELNLDELLVLLKGIESTNQDRTSFPRIFEKLIGVTKVNPTVTWANDFPDDEFNQLPTIHLYIYNGDIEQNTAIHDNVWNLIHPDIAAICKAKFKDGHYADAVETAFKEINSITKLKVKALTCEELDGDSLMRQAFSPNCPILELADQNTISGKNIQKGYMDIFAGAITGIRNPKAHENIVIDSQRAIHLLFLASLLMFKLDESKANFSHPKITKEKE